MSKIKENIRTVVNELEKYGSQQKTKIRFVAVSKGQNHAKIIEAYNEGQKVFDENYLQEAINKKEHLKDLEIEWHFIGPIQSNKCKLIAENFSWIQTVDRIKIARKLNEFNKTSIPLNICIQINISNEETKSGVNIDEIDVLIDCINSLDKLRLRGFMAIPSNTHKSEILINEYKKLKNIYDKFKCTHTMIDTLSMGMSNDYLLAIENGSNLVRIGSKIFGSRL